MTLLSAAPFTLPPNEEVTVTLHGLAEAPAVYRAAAVKLVLQVPHHTQQATEREERGGREDGNLSASVLELKQCCTADRQRSFF